MLSEYCDLLPSTERRRKIGLGSRPRTVPVRTSRDLSPQPDLPLRLFSARSSPRPVRIARTGQEGHETVA